MKRIESTLTSSPTSSLMTFPVISLVALLMISLSARIPAPTESRFESSMSDDKPSEDRRAAMSPPKSRRAVK